MVVLVADLLTWSLKGRVEVLRVARARVEACHDDNHVDKRGLVLLEREPGFARECSEPVSLLVSGCVGAVGSGVA